MWRRGGRGAWCQQQAEDRQVNRRRYEWCNPDRHIQVKGEVEDVAEAEEEREPDDGAHDHGDGLHDWRRIRA
jgi:hypothetical protein